MRPLSVAIAGWVLLSPHASASDGHGGARWYPSPGDPAAWSATLPAPSAEPVPLLHRPEFPAVESFSIPLLDGGRFDPGSARGRIVLLDFWASWCEPCNRELPHLERLWKSRGPRGFDAIAVNVEEAPELARRAAARLGLTLPLGTYDSKLDERFAVRTLPTVVLLDREGRLRARWDGYVDGLESTIAKRVDALLADDSDAAPREVGRVDPGGTAARVAWVAELSDPVGGVSFYRTAEGAPRVAATAGNALAVLDGEGRPVRRLRVPPDVHRLVTATPGPDRAPRLLAWREGGDRAIEIRPETERLRALLAPAVVWDLAEAPSSGDPMPGVAWATPVGLFLSGHDGSSPRRVGEAFEARRVVRNGDSFLVLDRAAGVREIRDGGSSRLTVRDAEGIVGLVDGAGGSFGVLASPVLDAALGAFVGPRVRGVAVAAAPDRVVVLDLTSGAVIWSATCSDVFDLDVGDLDGDGSDELLIAAGKRIVALDIGPPGTGP